MIAKIFFISQKETTGKIGYYEVSTEKNKTDKTSETVYSTEKIIIKSNEDQLLQTNDQSSILLMLIGLCLFLVAMLLLMRRKRK